MAFIRTLSAAVAVTALILAVSHPTAAIVRSLNRFSANKVRAELPEDAFTFDPRTPANVLKLPFGTLSLGTVDQFPALGGADVQMAYVRVTLFPGSTLPAHLHPRGTELDYVVRGVIKTVIAEEFGSARPSITVVLGAGKLAVVPEGLTHAQTCVSKEACVFVATFNTADPGTALAGSSVCALKDEQVAATLGNRLGPRGARAFCDGGVL